MEFPPELQARVDKAGSVEAAIAAIWAEKAAPATEIQQWNIEDPAVRKTLSQLVGDAGSIEAAVQQLYQDNYRQRQSKRAAQSQIEAYETKLAEQAAAMAASNTPGSLTLAPDEASQWQQFKEIGDYATVQAQIEAGQAAGQELSQFKRREHLREVAEVAGFNPKVFNDLDAQAGALDYEIQDVTAEDGTTAKRAVVRTEGQDPVDLRTLAGDQWADYLPVLQAGTQDNGDSGSTARRTQHIRQHSGTGDDNQGSIVQQRLQAQRERNAARPNPLQKYSVSAGAAGKS